MTGLWRRVVRWRERRRQIDVYKAEARRKGYLHWTTVEAEARCDLRVLRDRVAEVRRLEP